MGPPYTPTGLNLKKIFRFDVSAPRGPPLATSPVLRRWGVRLRQMAKDTDRGVAICEGGTT